MNSIRAWSDDWQHGIILTCRRKNIGHNVIPLRTCTSQNRWLAVKKTLFVKSFKCIDHFVEESNDFTLSIRTMNETGSKDLEQLVNPD